ncbi:MAG: hypothetical protein ACI8WM_000368 [Burkholderiaceae bacterium]|jgi:hypothetical protein
MKAFVLTQSDSVFGSPIATSFKSQRRTLSFKCLPAALLSAGLIVANPTLANDVLPSKSHEQSVASKAVQPHVCRSTPCCHFSAQVAR